MGDSLPGDPAALLDYARSLPVELVTELRDAQITALSDAESDADRAALQSAIAILEAAVKSRRVKHQDVRWNPVLGEWFCATCGRTSDHAAKEDAHTKLEQYACKLPAKDPEERPVDP